MPDPKADKPLVKRAVYLIVQVPRICRQPMLGVGPNMMGVPGGHTLRLSWRPGLLLLQYCNLRAIQKSVILDILDIITE